MVFESKTESEIKNFQTVHGMRVAVLTESKYIKSQVTALL